MTASDTSADVAVEDVQQLDAERHVENKMRFGTIYDAWDNESPAGMSNRFSSEVRENLKGQLQQ